MNEHDLKESITKLQASVSKIEDALLGDKFDEEGFIPQLKKIKAKVQTHDLYFKVGITFVIVVGVVISIVTDFFKLL